MKPPVGQQNLQRAIDLGFDSVRRQTARQLIWLGAEAAGEAWTIAVLNDAFCVDLANRTVTTATGREVTAAWRILALHYLSIDVRPDCLAPQITFADLPNARSYAPVYQRRTTGRLCATAGRDAATLLAAAAAAGGRPGDGEDSFDFHVFPRIRLRLLWHAGDEEFPPSATLLLPPNIEEYFVSEDIVVLSESLVARLGGRPF